MDAMNDGQFYRRMVYYNYGIVCIKGPHAAARRDIGNLDNWDVDLLREELTRVKEMLRVFATTTTQGITAGINMDYLKAYSMDSWSRFCGIVKEYLLNIDHLIAIAEYCAYDEELWIKAGLLLQPANGSGSGYSLSKLTLSTYDLQLGLPLHKVFPNLTELTIEGGIIRTEPASTESILLLAESLKNLPLLRKFIQHSNWPNLSLPALSWKPVVDVIRKKTTLEEVNIQRGSHWPGLDGGPTELSPSEADLEAMQFGPRLNEAKRQFFPPQEEEVRLEQWVEAMVSVRDRVDCVDHLLRHTVDPNLYGKAAITAAEAGANLKARKWSKVFPPLWVILPFLGCWFWPPLMFFCVLAAGFYFGTQKLLQGNRSKAKAD